MMRFIFFMVIAVGVVAQRFSGGVMVGGSSTRYVAGEIASWHVAPQAGGFLQWRIKDFVNKFRNPIIRISLMGEALWSLQQFAQQQWHEVLGAGLLWFSRHQWGMGIGVGTLLNSTPFLIYSLRLQYPYHHKGLAIGFYLQGLYFTQNACEVVGCETLPYRLQGGVYFRFYKERKPSAHPNNPCGCH